MQEENVSCETSKDFVVVVESYFLVESDSATEALKLATEKHSAAEIDSDKAKLSGTEVGIYLDEGEEVEDV